MKLGKTHAASGQVIVERTTRRNEGKEVLDRETRTEGLGPFTRQEIHARVGTSVSATLSRNYHSVNIGVTINIPVDATTEKIDEGMDWVFRKANRVLNKELKGAKDALTRLAKE
jgi:hypothetical protein